MKETSKNIIFFLPNFSKGGSGYAILKLCRHLKNKNFNLNVICIGKCALKKQLSSNKVKVYEIQSRSTFFSIDIIDTTWRSAFLANPFYYLISNTRKSFNFDQIYHLKIDILLLILVFITVYTTLYIFKKGYRVID